MKWKNRLSLFVLTIAFLVFTFFPGTALADIPIWTFMTVMPAMGMALAPIIVIEAWIGVRYVQFRWSESFQISVTANFASTMLGIPITHLILELATSTLYGATHPGGLFHVISMYLLQPFILFPFWKSWAYPLVFIGWLIPMFFVTVWVERIVARRLLKAKSNAATIANRWSFAANLASYAFLAILLLVWFVFEVVSS